MRWGLAMLVVVAYAAGVQAQSGGCSDEAPCVLVAELTDDQLTVAPSGLTSLGPYVLHAYNNGTLNATLVLAGSALTLDVPANGTAVSQAFTFPGAGPYELTADDRVASLEVSAPAASPDGLSRNAHVLAILLPVLVGIALVGIASLVLRYGNGQRHNLFFAGLYIISGIKSVSEGLSLLGPSVHASAPLFPEALFWQFLGLFAGIALLPLLVLFVTSFPHPAAWLRRRPALASLAFLPSALFALVILLVVQGQIHPAWFSLGSRTFNFLLVAATVVTVAHLLRLRRGSPDPVERKQATYVLVGFLPAFVLGWTITAVQEATRAGTIDSGTADEAVRNVLHFVSPLFELVACSLVAFAILKYNILGIDPKFRLGVKSVTVGLLFVLIFLFTQFVESIILEGQIFSFLDDYTAGTGSFLLSGVTGLVLFKPIERVSTKVSNKLLPPQEVTGGSKHAEEIYHAQASYVLRDAKVTDRELEFLHKLRDQLGLSDSQARRIEETVERLLHVDDERLGQRAVGSGAPPSTTALAHAQRHAADVAGGDLDVRRAARTPPSPPATAAANKPRPSPAAARPGDAPTSPAKSTAGRPAAPRPNAPSGKAAKAPGRPGGAPARPKRKEAPSGKGPAAPGKARK